ncbi:MAG: hypothetical protein ABIH39_05410 [Candidatus Margulisiibacteriota bacterium]
MKNNNLHIPFALIENSFPESLNQLEIKESKTAIDVFLPREICYYFQNAKKLSKYEIEDIFLEHFTDDPENILFQTYPGREHIEVIAVPKRYIDSIKLHFQNRKLRIGDICCEDQPTLPILKPQPVFSQQLCGILAALMIISGGILFGTIQDNSNLKEEIKQYRQLEQQLQNADFTPTSNEHVPQTGLPIKAVTKLLRQITAALPMPSTIHLQEIYFEKLQHTITGFVCSSEGTQPVFKYLKQLKLIPEFSSASIESLEKSAREEVELVCFRVMG